MEKVRYYNNENDDFAKNKIDTVKIDGTYKYIHKNIIWNTISLILYRIIATPLAYIYSKIKFRFKVINKQALNETKSSGYFMYINHTQEILDTLLPTLIGFPKKAYIIAHPNNVSINGLKTANKMLGALPIPGDIESSKNFLEAIKKYVNKKSIIAVYPEAHVWPYYTKIRNFNEVSFRYPVKLNVPVFSVTITYKESKRKTPNIVAFVDGPFYPNESKNVKEAEKDLRDNVYNTMIKRSKNSDIEYIKYINRYKGENND